MTPNLTLKSSIRRNSFHVSDLSHFLKHSRPLYHAFCVYLLYIFSVILFRKYCIRIQKFIIRASEPLTPKSPMPSACNDGSVAVSPSKWFQVVLQHFAKTRKALYNKKPRKRSQRGLIQDAALLFSCLFSFSA